MDMDMHDSNGNELSVTGEDNLFSKYDKLIPHSRQERSKIVEAGVPAVERNLFNYTPTHPHNYPSNNLLRGKQRTPLHIKQGITHQPNEYIDGSTDVGFDKGSEPIAYWVDQGTYRQQPQNFIEHAYSSLDKNEVFGPEAAVYKQILHDCGIDIE